MRLIYSEFRQVLKLKDTKFGGVTVAATDLEEAVEKVDPSECQILSYKLWSLDFEHSIIQSVSNP